jgi:hypothetical protein
MPDLQILAAMKQCPSNPNGLPYLSIILAGTVADELAMPCTTSQDTCSASKGMICADLSVTKPFGVDLFGVGSNPSSKTPADLNSAFFSAMKDIGFYDDNDARPGCYSMATLISGVFNARSYLAFVFTVVYCSCDCIFASGHFESLLFLILQICGSSCSATFRARPSRPPPLPRLGSFASPTPH